MKLRIRSTIILFLTLALIFAGAAIKFGLTWDESTYILFSDHLKDWITSGFPGHFHYDLVQNPHPPFMRMMSMLGAIFFPFAGFPLAYRLAHIIFASGGISMVFYLLMEEFGLWPSLAAVLFIILPPRFFAETFNATTDGPVAVGWLCLAILTWRISRPDSSRLPCRRGPWIAFFVVHAMITATKFTGFIAIAPALLWHFSRRDWRGFGLTLASGVAALAFLTVLPFSGIHEFLTYPFHRHEIAVVPTFYLGQIFGERLPWHYFFVMSLVTFPPLFALLGGFALVCRGTSATGRLLIALSPWILVWVAMGLIPGIPKHDGVRQFVAFFPLASLLAWVGSMRLHDWLTRKFAARSVRRWATASVCCPLLFSAIALVRIHPFELSYYDFLVGGLGGAERRGLELNYFLEAFNQDALHWLNANAKTGETIAMIPPWPLLLRTYQSKGLIRPDLKIVDRIHEAEATYLVLIRRRSMVNDEAYLAAKSVFETSHSGVSLVKILRQH